MLFFRWQKTISHTTTVLITNAELAEVQSCFVIQKNYAVDYSSEQSWQFFVLEPYLSEHHH